MKKKIKYGKIAIVVIITVLIWVWADLAQDEEYAVTGFVTIAVVQSNPDCWVSFDEKSSASVQEVVVKGPASKIAELERELKDAPEGLEFPWYPEKEIVDRAEYDLDVLNFLKQSKQIKQRGLTVESCQPETIPVSVEKLVEKSLRVQCVDENKIPIKDATVKPERVDMAVPVDWEGERLVATVLLTSLEIDQARSSPVEGIPYIDLAPDQIRKSPTGVEITLPSEKDPRKAETIQNVTLGYSFSGVTQGKYKVEVNNLTQVIGAIRVKATPAAKQAYEDQRFQVTLEIDDEDINAAEPRRELVYNFPERYARKNEIELDQQPVTARFKLIPLDSAESPSSTAD